MTNIAHQEDHVSAAKVRWTCLVISCSLIFLMLAGYKNV